MDKQYSFINLIFNEKRHNIEKLIESHSFPNSMLCLYSKVLQIEFIKKSLDTCDNNFYSSQVLLRILLEHYLVGYYMYFKTTVDDNDLVGEVYYGDYLKSEIIKRENYYFNLDKIKNELKHTNINGYLSKYGDDFTDLTQIQIDKIHQNAAQFSNIKAVIKFLFSLENQSSKQHILHSKLFDFLEKYNKLSSYVHGGVTAEAETFNKDNILNNESKISENKQWGVLLETYLKFYFLFILFKNDHEEMIKLKGFF